MILVDIYIPSLDKVYDFQVDEKVSVENLVVEVAEMIANETRSGRKSEAEQFLLCSVEKGMILPGKSTLQACGMRNGSRLLLV